MFKGVRVLQILAILSVIGVDVADGALCQSYGIRWTYFHPTQTCYHLVEQRNSLLGFSERFKNFSGAWTSGTPCDKLKGGLNSNETGSIALLQTKATVDFLKEYFSETSTKALVNANLTSLNSLETRSLWYKVLESYNKQGILVNASSDVVSLLLTWYKMDNLFQSDGFYIGNVLCQVARGPVVPPSCPTRLEIDIRSNTSVLLKWKPGINGGAPQTFTISLYYCSYSTSSSCSIAYTGSVSEISYTGLFDHSVFNLKPNLNRYYRFSIATKNVKGNATYCQDVYQSLDSAPMPPSCPTDFEMDMLSESVGMLSWKPGFHGRLGQTFLLSLHECQFGWTRCTLKKSVTEYAHTYLSWRYYLWTDLKTSSNKLYMFTIQAENGRGKSEKCPNAVKIFQQDNTLPSCPTEMEINILSRSEVQLLWRPGMGGGQALKFTVIFEFCSGSYSLSCSKADQTTIPLLNNLGTLNYTVYNLTIPRDKTTYKFTVIPKNSKGLAANCKSIYRSVEAVPSEPSCPTDVDADVISDSTILLSWKPGNDGGLTQKFSVNVRGCNASSFNCTSGNETEIKSVENLDRVYTVLSGVRLNNLSHLLITVRASNPRGFARTCQNSTIEVTVADFVTTVGFYKEFFTSRLHVNDSSIPVYATVLALGLAMALVAASVLGVLYHRAMRRARRAEIRNGLLALEGVKKAEVAPLKNEYSVSPGGTTTPDAHEDDQIYGNIENHNKMSTLQTEPSDGQEEDYQNFHVPEEEYLNYKSLGRHNVSS